MSACLIRARRDLPCARQLTSAFPAFPLFIFRFAGEWVVDRFGNSKRCARVLREERKLFGNGLHPAPHASHIEASLHAMRQTHEKHRKGEVACPHTGRLFRNHSTMRKYHESLATVDPRTGLPTITDETIRQQKELKLAAETTHASMFQ